MLSMFGGSQEGCHETHGGTGRFDVDDLRHILQCLYDDFGVVTITQVLWKNGASRQCMNDECTI